MKDQNTVLLVISLGLAIASGVLAVMSKAWGLLCAAVAIVLIAAVLLF